MKLKNRAAGHDKNWARQLLSSVVAVLLALVLGGVVIAVAGANPFTAYGVLLRGAFGDVYAWSETLLRATPILIAGIGLSISFRSNLTSIGAEGQIILGGIVSCAVGLWLPAFLPGAFRLVIGMLAGFAGGALYALLPGVLKAKLGTSEIIVTIMMNYIAISLLSFLLGGPLQEAGSFYPQSAQLDSAMWLPAIIPGTRIHLGFVLALVFVVAYYFLMFHLPLGFKIRMVGFNPKAAQYAGVKVPASIITAMMLSGGLAGIAGAGEVYGIHHRLYNDFAAGFGFDAIAVALLGRLHPIGVLVSAIFFAALKVGSGAMQRAVQVPTTIVYIIQGLLIMFVFTDKLLLGWMAKLGKRGGKKAVAQKEG